MPITDSSRIKLPKHWLKSQRFAFGLNLLQRKGPKYPKYQELLTTTFNHLPKPYCSKTFQGIHPATLKVLTDIDCNLIGEWGKFQDLWSAIYDRLQPDKYDNRLSRLGGAKLVANRIMTTNFKASQIAEIAQSEMGIKAPWPNEAIEPLQKFVEEVRQWNLPTQKRLRSLANFKTALKKCGLFPLEHWKIVENALLQQWFIWPLLIFEDNANEKTALSIPLALDVSLNENNFVELIKEHEFFKCDKSFEESLYKGRKAACELWKNKHLSWPPTFVRHIESLKMSIDLTVGESIIEPYSDFLPEKIILKEESAGLYFALAVLSKLVDPATLEGVCATGIIGNIETDPNGGANHILNSPGSLQAKINYTLGSCLFDTFLAPFPSSKKHVLDVGDQTDLLRLIDVPKEWERSQKKSKKSSKARPLKVPKLSEAANVVFGQKWRKHQYVRAPDLAISFKPGPRQGYTGDPQESAVEDVLKKIRENTDPVLQLDNTDPHDVAKALYYINHIIPKSAFEDDKAKHVGTYAFVRVVQNEINDRLWQTVWQVINGDTQSLNDFLFTSSAEKSAEIFANEMNKRPEKKPWRAPDVLVLVGRDGETRSTAIPNGPFARHKIANLVPHLNGKLQQTRVTTLRKHLGKTRLILVPDDQLNIKQCPAPEDTCPDLHDMVAKLSVFRFGFTREMARRMWDVSDVECEQLLKQGMGSGLLDYAQGAGEYIVHIKKRKSANDHSANDHYEAAQAIISFLNPDRDARRLNLTESLSPYWLHEAQWHLQEVRQLKGGKLHPVNFVINRLDHLGEWFGWTRVRWAIRCLREQKTGTLGEDGELVKGATALLDASVEHFKDLREQKIWLRNTHPMDFIYCARLASELAKHLPEKRKKLYHQRDQFLAQACERLKKPFDFLQQAEKDACFYVLQTSKACMQFDEICTNFAVSDDKYISTDDHKRIQKIWEKNKDIAKSCVEYKYEIIDGRWFEYMGDAAFDHKAAMFFYERGILNPNISALPSTVVKYLGSAAIIEECVPEKVHNAILEVKDKNLTIPKSSPCFYFLSQVEKRWKEGEKDYKRYG